MSDAITRWRNKIRVEVKRSLANGDDERACAFSKALSLTHGVPLPNIAQVVLLVDAETRARELDGLRLAADWLKGEVLLDETNESTEE